MRPINGKGIQRNSAMTRIPIFSLSGGVGRQAPAKRTPFEAENIDNCFVTVERSIEKRSGFEVMHEDTPEIGGGYTYHAATLGSTVVGSMFFYWLNINKDNRYLIALDYTASSSTAKLLYTYKLYDNTWTDVSPLPQWDPNDSTLTMTIDPAVEFTDTNDLRYPIYRLSAGENPLTTQVAYDAALASGVINKESRRYTTFGSSGADLGGTAYTAAEALRIVSVGTNMIVLNTLVEAGFSSTAAGFKVDLAGNTTATVDTKGREVTYYTAARVQKMTSGRLYPEGTAAPSGDSLLSGWTVKFLPVEDYVYAEVDRPWLGQSVVDFSEIRFPPDKNDWYANNGDTYQTPDDYTARDMLIDLYDSTHPHVAATQPVAGRGKIYYCAGPYLSQPAGYYRIINFPETESYDPDGAGGGTLAAVAGTGRPYSERVRTPDAFSYLDPDRMPQNLVFTAGSFNLEPIAWEPRTTGTRYTNPGPSPFLSQDKLTNIPRRINSMSAFRDRLFFSIGDVVFSSQLGSYENLWINDPSSITSSDPIDIRASSNQYAEIVSLTPFDEFLFVNTKGDVQFELRGSQNVISPLTAEISPTTFYATAPLIDPVLIGSQIYFFDDKRLYIYFSQRVRGLNTAIEVSANCPNYLPSDISAVCTAVAQDTILAVDADNRNHIYLYTNRYAGEQVLQSAFYRFKLADNEKIQTIQSYDNYLHAVIYRENEGRLYIMRCLLTPHPTYVPRLDSYVPMVIDENFSSTGLNSSFQLGFGLTHSSVYVVLGDDWDEQAGDTYLATVSNQNNTANISILGIDLTENIGKTIYVGGTFDMVVELSEQFRRDDGNNVVPGVLNLKTLNTRHDNTGGYTVEVVRLNRTETLESEFSSNKLDALTGSVSSGEFLSKVFSFSHNAQVFIKSSLSTPCNIVSMEFKGKFKQRNTSAR